MIQDGTDLNFATRPKCGGLQVIGRDRTGAAALGLHMHPTLAVTGAGLPLGVCAWGSIRSLPHVTRSGVSALKAGQQAAPLPQASVLPAFLHT